MTSTSSCRGRGELRCRGQSFELAVPLGPDLAHASTVRTRIATATPTARPIELVAVRTAETVAGPTLDSTGGGGRRVTGPALVELPGATCWVAAGWVGEADAHGTLVLERRG